MILWKPSTAISIKHRILTTLNMKKKWILTVFKRCGIIYDLHEFINVSTLGLHLTDFIQILSDAAELNPTKSWWTLLKRPSETKTERGNTDNKYIVVLLWTVWTSSTSGAGTANPSGAPEFTTGFCGIHVTRS